LGNAKELQGMPEYILVLHKIQFRGPVLSLAHNAHLFVDSCDAGRGWTGCKYWCHDDASYSCEIGQTPNASKLAAYTDSKKKQLLLGVNCENIVKCLDVYDSLDPAYAVAKMRYPQTNNCGPAPSANTPTDPSYAYIIEFEGDKIRHVIKVSNEPRELLYPNCKEVPLRPMWSG
jgi:hypothetical protein